MVFLLITKFAAFSRLFRALGRDEQAWRHCLAGTLYWAWS
jgi:hypothetical protein